VNLQPANFDFIAAAGQQLGQGVEKTISAVDKAKQLKLNKNQLDEIHQNYTQQLAQKYDEATGGGDPVKKRVWLEKYFPPPFEGEDPIQAVDRWEKAEKGAMADLEQQKVQKFKAEATKQPQAVQQAPVGQVDIGQSKGLAGQQIPQNATAKDLSAFPQSVQQMQDDTLMAHQAPQAMDRPAPYAAGMQRTAEQMNIEGNKDVAGMIDRKRGGEAGEAYQPGQTASSYLAGQAADQGTITPAAEAIGTASLSEYKLQTTDEEKRRVEEQRRGEEENRVRHEKAMEGLEGARLNATVGQKKDQRTADRKSKLSKDLDPSGLTRGPMSISKQVIDRADRLRGLDESVKAFQDGNADSRQIEELAIGMNSLLAGANTGAMQQVQALVPKTAVGNAAKLAEWLTNNPTGTKQRAFVERMMNTVRRERQVAENQVQKTRYQRIAQYQDVKDADPEGYAEVLRSWGVEPSDYEDWVKGGHKDIDPVTKPAAGGGGGTTGETPSNLPRFNSSRDPAFQKLPLGSKFIDDRGVVRTKHSQPQSYSEQAK
jgi:hypothetical protein